MAKESYDELIFELGDLAREHLASLKSTPKILEAVFAAEDGVLACREAIEAAEEELNRDDGLWQDFLAAQGAEKAEQKAIIAKWRSAVAGVEARSRALKKKLASLKAAFRYQRDSLRHAQKAHKEMEMREGHDPRKIELSNANLKKSRLHLMRDQRHIEELEWEFNQVLTPRPGQPGAQGILAHKRILEMEDELEEREHEYKKRMKELDEVILAKEEELKAAEAELDATLFELGEECYSARTPHPKLNPLYSRIDRAS